MKFLTREIYETASEPGPNWDKLYVPAKEAYRQHLRRIAPLLPPEILAIADPHYLDDALISRVRQDAAGAPLQLVLRRGDSRDGYSDLELTYVELEMTPEHFATLAEVARSHRTQLRYVADGLWHEVDVLPDGRTEHRFLFHRGVSFSIRSRQVRVKEVPKPSRRLAAYRHRVRIPHDLDELRAHLPSDAASRIHSYWSDKSWMEPLLRRDGYLLIQDALRWEDMEPVKRALAAQGRAGLRGILSIPEVEALVSSEIVRALVEPILGSRARPVRGIFFDKSPDANWKVPWHQDVTIAVRDRHEVEGFGPWSVKGGLPHVQPPSSVLERMLSVRLHLDDCGTNNGPLKVVPGSHLRGKLQPSEVVRVSNSGAVVCEAREGDALLMRPLLLHASSPAVSPTHRRVIHIEFAAEELPAPLEWPLYP